MFLNTHKRKHVSALVLAAASALAIAPQLARAEGPGAAAEPRQGKSGLPTASLNAQVFETVEHDTVTIVLAAEFSEASQEVATRKLTEALDSVMKQAKAEQKVEARSGNYRVWPHTDKKGAITNWRGMAEVVLESSDFAAASKLAAQLSDRMPIAGMNFSVSKELRAEREQALLADAAKAFQARAQAVAESFGFASYRIKNVEVGGSGYAPSPMPRMAMQSSAKVSSYSADVPVEPGTETIALSMQGSIFLLERK